MRKENSVFNMAYLSNEGTQLFNNDYYGSAELDKFACYVVADGFESGEYKSESARVAVEAVISEFLQNPSVSKRALTRMLDEAHKALHDNPGNEYMEASITIVVTDYQKVRYAYAGNSRFYLFRSGRMIEESRDHSLSWKMMEQDDIPKDKIATHIERNNLSVYLGQEEKFKGAVSKKIKLNDGDIITLLTKGVWEQVDAKDIKAAVDSAEDDPNKALDGLERLMLDAHPNTIDNYTIAFIFVNKVFTDPNRSKKIKRILMIVIPLAVIVIVLVILLIVFGVKRTQKYERMQTAYLSGIEYIADENFIRAKEDLDLSYQLADELRDSDQRNKLSNYQKFIDAIINADTLFSSGEYADAQAAYLIAQDRSRYTDNMAADYISRKLTIVAGYLNVQDLISLGDNLTAQNNYDLAEQRYLEALQLASTINYVDGKTQVMSALDYLYAKIDDERAGQQAASESEVALLAAATSMESSGDQAVADRDYTSAKLYYEIARGKFVELGDDQAVLRIDDKLSSLGGVQSQDDKQIQAAKDYEATGDAAYEAADYVGAKQNYILARNIYSRLGDQEALSNVQDKIDLCDIQLP